MTTIPGNQRAARSAASLILPLILLTLLAVMTGLLSRRLLDGQGKGFGADAAIIQAIMSSPFDVADLGDGSFAAISNFYLRLGLADSPTAASILGALVGSAVLGAVLLRVGHISRSPVPLTLLAAAPVLIGVYEASYAKEVVISLGMLAITLLPLNLLGEALVFATMIALGLEFRTYWIIVAVIYVAVRWTLLRRVLRTPFQVLLLVTGLSALLGAAVWIGLGVPADNFREIVNISDSRQTGTGSLITRFIDAPEPVGGILNTTLTTVFFVIPVPMLIRLSPYYLAVGLTFALIWISTLRSGTAPASVHRGPRDRLLHARLTALPLSFLIVQGIFEPDWGSALRHLTPLLPLIIGSIILTSDPPATSRPVTDSRHSPDRKTYPMSVDFESSPYDSATTAPKTEHNVTAYLGNMRRWWWMLVTGLVIGAAVGWGGSALMQKEYTAVSQVYIGSAHSGNSSDAYNGLLLSQKQVGSYAEIATSRTLAQRVIDDLNIDKTAADLSSMISASSHKDTVILDLKATSVNPELSRDIANSAAIELQKLVTELNEKTSTGTQVSGPQLALLNEAETPSVPSSPNTVLNVIMASLLGLLVGVGAALVRGFTDRRITSRDVVRGIVDAPVIGTISTDDELSENHTIDFTDAPTATAEQFRELRTNLRFLDVDNAPKVLTVTSGIAGAGKSTLAVNLARALADDGESVCLVDADLRSPSVAPYLGGSLQPAVGLSTVLSNAAELADVIQPSSSDNLSVITAGAIPPNPAELLGSRRFTTVLSELAQRFDHVIVDASPVLPVTDGALVAASADGVLLAVRYGETTTDELTDAEQTLAHVNARILGTVFTCTPRAGKGAHGDRYGYGSYGYGSTTAGAAVAPEEPAADAPAGTES